MELTEQLAIELNRLERQAGRVGALLAKAEPELAEMALSGWAPAPPKGRQRAVWAQFWRQWLEVSAWRLGLADSGTPDSLQRVDGSLGCDEPTAQDKATDDAGHPRATTAAQGGGRPPRGHDHRPHQNSLG